MRKFERITHYGKLEGGKLVLDNARWFKGMLQLYEDTPVAITLERKRKSRSRQQLGYLWGVVYPLISQHTGHSPEDLHDIFKAKYLKRKKLWRGGEIVTIGTTTELSTNEMAEFITNVILEASELEIVVPEPDPAYQWK